MNNNMNYNINRLLAKKHTLSKRKKKKLANALLANPIHKETLKKGAVELGNYELFFRLSMGMPVKIKI